MATEALGENVSLFPWVYLEEPISLVRLSYSVHATNNAPFPTQDGRVGCQSWHWSVSSYSAAGGEQEDKQQELFLRTQPYFSTT